MLLKTCFAAADGATAANLKKVFDVEGAGLLDESEFKEENVDIEFGKPEGGKVNIKVTPKDLTAKQFFFRSRTRTIPTQIFQTSRTF